jgi:hypothetical protein
MIYNGRLNLLIIDCLFQNVFRLGDEAFFI